MPEYKIEGILKLTSPLHVATPGDRVINVETLEPKYGKSKGKDFVSYTGTTKYPLAFSEEDMQNEEADDPNERGVIYVPIFPANDARGRLRRLAAEKVFKVLRSRGELLTLETYHGMTCGAVTGQPGKGLLFELALKSGRHAFLGLFGGGPRLISSSVQIHTLWPVTKTTINAGLVSSAYEDESVLVRMNSLTKPLFYRRIDDALVFSDGRHAELSVKEYSTAVAAWIKELGSAKSDEGDKVRHKKQLQTFGAIEYVIPGTRLYSEIKIDTERTGLGSLGLLIHALTAFATKQGIGGWARNGFGRFEAQFDLVTADNVRVPLLTKTDAGYEPNVDAEEVAEALDAWATVSATINAAELEDLYALPASTEESAEAAAA
jgi:CRISPR type IV-associated protein Csf2